MILLTIALRELARVIAASYHGLQLRSILLLPIGGLFSYSNAESLERANEPKLELEDGAGWAARQPIASALPCGSRWLGVVAGSPNRNAAFCNACTLDPQHRVAQPFCPAC